MSYINFDRHSIFTSEMNSDHLRLITAVSDASYDVTGSTIAWDSVINMLYGIFDGYLYDSLLEECKILPSELYTRVENTVNYIKSNI